MFNTNAQCYQNISQVLLTSAFMLWPTCTRGFGIREKIRCSLRFFGVFLCGLAVFGPPVRPPLLSFALTAIFVYSLRAVRRLNSTKSNSQSDKSHKSLLCSSVLAMLNNGIMTSPLSSKIWYYTKKDG